MSGLRIGAIVWLREDLLQVGVVVDVEPLKNLGWRVWWRSLERAEWCSASKLLVATGSPTALPTAAPIHTAIGLQRRIERARDGHLAAMAAADAAQRSNVRDMHCAVALAMGLLLADDERGAE